VALAGWSAASPLGATPSAQRQDLVMSARSAASVLGGLAPPPPLAKLLKPYLDGDAPAMPTLSAWELAERVGQAAKQAYGPPKYIELSMPGWPRT
jgi:hypothetical protein